MKRYLSGLLLTGLLAACTETPPTHFYTLSTQPPADAPVAGDKTDGLVLADSYHCSRYNTNTGVLIAVPLRGDVESPWLIESDEESWKEKADEPAAENHQIAIVAVRRCVHCLHILAAPPSMSRQRPSNSSSGTSRPTNAASVGAMSIVSTGAGCSSPASPFRQKSIGTRLS